MNVEAIRELQTPHGRRLLARVTTAYGDREPTADAVLALSGRLHAEHPAELVAAALTQARLRVRAGAKLGAIANRLLLTPAGLEQATRSSVAEHRAARLRAVLGEGARVADLCCGIGGDLLALAGAGLRVTGLDRDPVAAEAARANLAACGLPGMVRLGDATAVDRAPYDACVADPARRSATGRALDPDDWSPPWAWVREVLDGTACVKVAPGIAHARVPHDVEAEWVSDGGDVVEAALWSGRLRETGVRRRATLLPAGVTLTEADDPGEAPVLAPSGYLYEPDGAVIRAGLVTAVAERVGGGLLDPRIAYVVSDRLVPTPFARAYAVREVLPWREKAVRALVRDRGIGILTIKKRGVDVDPAALRRRLRPAGDATGTLVITRITSGRTNRPRGEAVAMLVEPLPRP